MRCLNCGYEGNQFLCVQCRVPDILNKIFYDTLFYKPETCENPYLIEYASALSEKYAERDIIPDILQQFDFEVAEYYYCEYHRIRKDGLFENAAISYLKTHELNDLRTQKVLYGLIDNYIPNDFIKPKKWCEIIAASDSFCCELYAVAAKYFSMIGEYNVSDTCADKGLMICKSKTEEMFLFSTFENMISRLEKQKTDTIRYRTKKPYWPVTEERRRAIAMFYDEKGIKYPRIESRPQKIREDEFLPIKECYEDEIADYCAFWCSEAFTHSTVKCIYQIGAVRVRNHLVVDTFESFIRPWDATSSARKTAAKEVSVDLDVIESADDVDLVMPKFFSFVGNDVLISTDALGNQAKLISRAARYTGMKEIPNEFLDLLDFASDLSDDFDLANNTREYLLSHFSIAEGKTALEKAQVNKLIYDALLDYGD